jgi:hypothetical protein
MFISPERRRIDTFRKGVAERTYARFAAGLVLIWSAKRRAYLMPDRTGYTDRRDEAGRYTLDQAFAATFHRRRAERLWLEIAPEAPR